MTLASATVTRLSEGIRFVLVATHEIFTKSRDVIFLRKP